MHDYINEVMEELVFLHDCNIGKTRGIMLTSGIVSLLFLMLKELDNVSD